MHTNQAVKHGTRDPMRSPNVMRWLSARSGLWARRYPVKAFYFAKGGGNSIASGTAVSAGKYTARVGEEVLPAGRPGAAAKLRFALDSPREGSGFVLMVPPRTERHDHQPDQHRDRDTDLGHGHAAERWEGSGQKTAEHNSGEDTERDPQRQIALKVPSEGAAARRRTFRNGGSSGAGVLG